MLFKKDVTRQKGSGMTTMLKSMVHSNDQEFNTRVQELVSVLNLKYAYPCREILRRN